MSISFLFFTFYINFTSSSHIIYQQQSLLLILMRWTYIEWEDENVKKYERKKIKHFGINSNKDLCWSIWHRWREFELFSFIKITFSWRLDLKLFLLVFFQALTHTPHTHTSWNSRRSWVRVWIEESKKIWLWTVSYRIASYRSVTFPFLSLSDKQ